MKTKLNFYDFFCYLNFSDLIAESYYSYLNLDQLFYLSSLITKNRQFQSFKNLTYKVSCAS
jgi:hypothetical protein